MDDHRVDDSPAGPRDVFPAMLRPAAPHSRTTAPSVSDSAPGRRRAPLFVGLGLTLAIVALIAYGFTLSWTGTHRSPLALAFLRIQIIGGGVQLAIYALAALAVVFLLARRPTRRRLAVAAAALVGGAIVALIVLGVLTALNTLGVAISPVTSAWTVAGFAITALGIASLWSAKGWRTIGTALSIALVLLAGTLGVNADFGLDPTVGALAGVSTLNTVVVPVITSTPHPAPTALAGGALWANWDPPRDLPVQGSTGQVEIPGTISGFKSRPAGIYYPPAAMVKNPPALPLVIMLMGQPGNPDPSFQAEALLPMTKANRGLAPIVVVADQIGNPAVDPLCLDTDRYGKVETYITKDVVNWARTHLHILQDPAHWTIAGYSNGGECALYFGAKYPELWHNVLDISGEQYPGADAAASTLTRVFGGSAADYQATWPINILRTKTYPDMDAIFTVGSNDTAYRKVAQTVNAAASSAGWKTTYFEVPNGGHVLVALNGGLAEGYRVLYPRLGLSKPDTAAPIPAPTGAPPG